MRGRRARSWREKKKRFHNTKPSPAADGFLSPWERIEVKGHHRTLRCHSMRFFILQGDKTTSKKLPSLWLA